MNALICSRLCRSFFLATCIRNSYYCGEGLRVHIYMAENFHLLFGECTIVLKVPLFIPLAPCVFLQLCTLP